MFLLGRRFPSGEVTHSTWCEGYYAAIRDLRPLVKDEHVEFVGILAQSQLHNE
jgi:hypothetical protein